MTELTLNVLEQQNKLEEDDDNDDDERITISWLAIYCITFFQNLCVFACLYVYAQECPSAYVCVRYHYLLFKGTMCTYRFFYKIVNVPNSSIKHVCVFVSLCASV